MSHENFKIFITDNYADNLTELIVEYSLDEKIYQNLAYNFIFSLLPYEDDDYTLDIAARDLAGNIIVQRIWLTIDSTEPDLIIVIPELVDSISVDGNLFVPADALVQVTITDDDETTYSYYKINSGPKIPFTDSFILSFSYGPLILRIYANDTLGNERSISYNLVLDSLAPNVIQTFPTTIFNISDFSDLEFDIEDFTLKNIESVIYHWDDAVGLGDFDVNDVDPYLDGHFRLELGTSARVLYSFYEYTLANLTIFAVDFLGNNKTYVFNYEIDITPPNASLEYFNLTWIPMVEKNDPAYEIAGGSKIRYDNSTADDQLLIRYQWEINTELQGWEELDLMLNPEFELGKVDGNHTLIFEIQDNTGQGRTPNIKIATFNFYVDDMLIDFLYPIEFTDDFHYKMDYNDTFTYQVNITDAVDNEPIPGLVYEIFSDNVLNLSIIVTNINITIYEITIHATNV
ncbi:MAG: hypothetical protein H7644_14065, partial [Candidatus Heimdallarchaeota archaeon]|nr:hypothetical protein [Candidatus Heimdallarchaeota archaeon]MCK5144886.1 hypothetical protein [Candidatus Heimdallarchaeota archaeon]